MDLSESSGTVAKIETRPAAGGQAMLDRALSRARWSILWERLWPALASIATAVGLFLALSWLGLWMWLPPVGRVIGLGVFCVIAAAALLPLLRLRLPSRMEKLRRLDRNSGLTHRPATTISDRIAGETDDGHAVALWRAHIERALRSAKTLRAGLPMPRIAARDPVALRALVLVLVIATFFVAGGDRMRRVHAAFDWQGAITPANFRIDAWISPPPYTAKPPLILQGLRPGEPVQAASGPIAVPVGRSTSTSRPPAGSPSRNRPRNPRPIAARPSAVSSSMAMAVPRCAPRAISPGNSRRSPIVRRPLRSPASRKGRRTACRCPTSSRTTMASSARRRPSS
jgi:uncharacterized protein (TIGR02302 family)